MNVQVIIINGPSGSGKDELAAFAIPMIQRTHDATHQEFEEGIYLEVCSYFGVSREKLMTALNRISKESPDPAFTLHGTPISPVAAMIHVSDNIIKPLHGKSFFGDSATARLQTGLNLFTDGGFIEELVPVARMVGEENVLILRVIRPGFDFSKDSRDYITASHLADFGIPGVQIQPVLNSGTLDKYLEVGTLEITKFVNERLKAHLGQELDFPNIYREL
jgi:hypothetical protein